MYNLSHKLPNHLVIQNFGKLGKFKKIPEKLRNDGKFPASQQKAKLQQLSKKIAKNLV